MNDSEKAVSSVASFIGSGGTAPPVNSPIQYKSRQKQYGANVTRRYMAERAFLASDYVEVNAQGLKPSDFYAWVKTKARLADITAGTVMETRKSDDYKQVMFPDAHVDYFPIGAKMETMGSTWLCVNPTNIATVNARAVVARCNSSYNSYDDFGNVITEPLVFEGYSVHGNNDQSPKNLVLPDGNMSVTAQLNDNTRRLGHNQRIILGTKAYHITGWNDFMQEFTGNRDSSHLVTFTIRLEEPTENDDVTEHFIANGKAESFRAEVSAPETLTVGQTANLVAKFFHNDEENSEARFEWRTSDENVIEISSDGTVTAVGAGETTLTAVLAQNNEITATVGIVVQRAHTEPYVAFKGITDDAIQQFKSATYSAAFYDENNEETDDPMVWTYSGAKSIDFSAVESDDGKSVTVYCISASDVPLTITASRGIRSASVTVNLEGY